jgi:hypothetical protein
MRQPTRRAIQTEGAELSDVRKLKKSQRKCFEFMPSMRFAEGDGFVSPKALCMIIGAIIV